MDISAGLADAGHHSDPLYVSFDTFEPLEYCYITLTLSRQTPPNA